jgi:two-component system phosphate regulon sensor histidine kinase PhoR
MKIKTKVTSAYIVLAVFIIVGLGVFISLWIESYFKERMVVDLSRQADVIRYILQEDTIRSLIGLDSQIKKVGGFEHMRVTLIDYEGNVLTDSDVPARLVDTIENHLNRPEVVQARRNGVGSDIRHSATVGRDFLYVAKELKTTINRPVLRGLRYIRVSAPYEDVQDQINHIRSIVTVAGFGVLLIVMALSIFVSRRITTPMIRIVDGIERIHTGNYEHRLPVDSKDEIGTIAKAVNELVDRLKEDIVRLKKLEQVRSQFLGNVSHELRTPIFAIQGYLETLLSGALNDKSVNRLFLEKAQSNLSRLNTLLEDLINISQIESGEMKMSFRYFAINEFLESVCAEYEQIAKQHDVSLRLELGTGAEDMVFGDRDRLRQVLYNLIGNGINYNSKGGEVVVSAEKTDGKVQISVKDTGIGIAPEHLSRIFERFYRVDSDRSRELGGTGLGLAIVKHIMEAHDSHVDVDSRIGEGSTFRFLLKGSR